MNTRIWPIVAAVTLLSLSSGCSSMRNFLFGRGARCGNCRPSVNTAPIYTAPTYAAPAYTAPGYGPAQPAAIPYAQPVPIAPYQPRCKLFGRRWFQQPAECAPSTGCGCQDPCGNVCNEGCGTCYSCSSACGECAVASPCGGCGGSGCSTSGGGWGVSDPYLSSGMVVDGSVMPYEGQIIVDDQVIGDSGQSIIGSSVLPGASGLQDNFDARGDRIIHSDPLPPGAVYNQ